MKGRKVDQSQIMDVLKRVMGTAVEEQLERTVTSAMGEAISNVADGMPSHMQISMYARLLAVAAARSVKEGREAALIEGIFAKFNEDFKLVRKHMETCECGDDDHEHDDEPAPEEITRRAEGVYEPGAQ